MELNARDGLLVEREAGGGTDVVAAEGVWERAEVPHGPDAVVGAGGEEVRDRATPRGHVDVGRGHVNRELVGARACACVVDLDGAVRGGRGENVALRRRPLQLFDRPRVPAECVLGCGPSAVFAPRADEDGAVVVAGDEFAGGVARVRTPVEGVAFCAFMHPEGGGLIGGGCDGGAGGVEGCHMWGEVPDVDVSGFSHGGGESGV